MKYDLSTLGHETKLRDGYTGFKIVTNHKVLLVYWKRFGSMPKAQIAEQLPQTAMYSYGR